MAKRSSGRHAWAALGAGCLAVLGCASPPVARAPLPSIDSSPGRYLYFTPPPPGDPWSYRIGGWQTRQRAARGFPALLPRPELPPPVATEPLVLRQASRRPGSLASRYEDFLRFEVPRLAPLRETARDVLRWVQNEAKTRFIEDGPVDHWPTLTEMLASEGDDCDGMELLSYHALRQLGFGRDRVYRAILHRPRFGEHHMVTLWFEDAGDPWVLDPTATITTRLERLSDLDGWVPLKMFSESREFTVTSR